MKMIILAVAVSSVLSAGVNAASFDCSLAATSIEKMICSDTELSQLDSALLASYKLVFKTMKDNQRQWVKLVRNKQTNLNDMIAVYSDRIDYLNLKNKPSVQAVQAVEEVAKVENSCDFTKEFFDDGATLDMEYATLTPSYSCGSDNVNMLVRATSLTGVLLLNEPDFTKELHTALIEEITQEEKETVSHVKTITYTVYKKEGVARPVYKFAI